MSRLHTIRLVAAREILVRSRSRGYRISTALLVVLIIAGAVGLPRLDEAFDDDDAHRIAVTGGDAAELAQALEAIGEQADIPVETSQVATLAEAEALLADGDVDAVLAAGESLLFERDANDEIVVMANQAVRQVRLPAQLEAIGISAEELAPILQPAPLPVSLLEDEDDDEGAGIGVASISAILLFLAIMTYGQWVLQGVVEEKASRIVEVLLSTLRPYQLLAGKVAGILLLGIAQLAVLLAVGAAVVLLQGDLDIPDVAITGVLAAALWFVLGLALYGAAFGAAGALVSRQEEAANVTLPFTAMLMGGYFASIIVIQGNAGSSAATALALFPFTAPVVMPSVVALGEATWWEFGLAVVLMLAAIAATIFIGARIYTGAVLQIGPRVALRDAWRVRS